MDTRRLPDDVRADVTARLNRAAGQLRAVVRMLDEGADCQQTARQLAAAKRAVDRAGVRLLSGGLVACLTEQRDGDLTVDEFEKLFLELA